MMFGEFELDAYFEWSVTKATFGQISSQILFIAFVIIVSTVIHNLLIALTIDSIEEISRKAREYKLMTQVKLLQDFEKLHTSYNRCLVYFLEYGYRHRLEHLFKLNSQSNISSALPWKISVLPHSLDQLTKNSKGRKYLMGKQSFHEDASSFENDYDAYLVLEGNPNQKLRLGNSKDNLGNDSKTDYLSLRHTCMGHWQNSGFFIKAKI